MNPSLNIEDNTEDFMKLIDSFKNDNVLVGIPAEKTSRGGDEPINNAGILFINEFGSPANNIPPRPVMTIGIWAAQDQIAEEFKNALQEAFKSGRSAVNSHYNRAGMIAANSVKRVINDQIGIDEPNKSTIKARKAKGFNGTKSLVVTGQLRNSITWVVKEF